MKRFEINQEVKLLRLLNACFNSYTNSWSEEEAILKGVTIIDAANVLMCTGISEEAKVLLCRFKGFDELKKDEPNLNTNFDEKKSSNELAVSSFSMEYMNKIMRIMSLGEKIKITNRKDFPVIIENEHFRFILAPRVED